MRILVCGGRDLDEDRQAAIINYLFRMNDDCKITSIIHGGAAGADSAADRAAQLLSVPAVVYRASWRKYGKAAGPIRNQRMLDEGKPDIVVAFPGGRGTADMVRRAKAHGVPVEEAWR